MRGGTGSIVNPDCCFVYYDPIVGPFFHGCVPLSAHFPLWTALFDCDNRNFHWIIILLGAVVGPASPLRLIWNQSVWWEGRVDVPTLKYAFHWKFIILPTKVDLPTHHPQYFNSRIPAYFLLTKIGFHSVVESRILKYEYPRLFWITL